MRGRVSSLNAAVAGSIFYMRRRASAAANGRSSVRSRHRRGDRQIRGVATGGATDDEADPADGAAPAKPPTWDETVVEDVAAIGDELAAAQSAIAAEATLKPARKPGRAAARPP